MDTKSRKSKKTAKIIIFITILAAALVTVAFYPRMEKLIAKKQEAYRDEMQEYTNAGTTDSGEVDFYGIASGNPEAFSLQPNTINYAVESCYYLYGRLLSNSADSGK